MRLVDSAGPYRFFAAREMNRPALAFGVLLPYIRNEEELNIAVEAWIRSHFLYKRYPALWSLKRRKQLIFTTISPGY
jgi:hypothetical protein